MDIPEPENDFVAIAQDTIKAKILHVLSIYPMLSPSMLQVGIGTAVTPKLWHPILAVLIKEGKVERFEMQSRAPSGRDQTYACIRLIPQ